MSGDIKENVTRRSIWLRLVFMIVLSMAFNELFSVHARSSPVLGRYSAAWDRGLTRYTEKIWFPYKPLPVPKTSVSRTLKNGGR